MCIKKKSLERKLANQLPAHHTWRHNRIDALVRTIDMGRWNPAEWERAARDYEEMITKQSKHLQVLVQAFNEMKYNLPQIAFWISNIAEQPALQQKVVGTWELIHQNNQMILENATSSTDDKKKAMENNDLLIKILNTHLKGLGPRVEDVSGVIRSIAHNNANETKLDQLKTLLEYQSPVTVDDQAYKGLRDDDDDDDETVFSQESVALIPITPHVTN